MQIALQDLRRLGTLKIGEMYINTEFLNKLNKLNNECITIKSSSYTVPRVWNSLDKEILKPYSSIIAFMNIVEPTIEFVGYNEINQRKFRNMWERLFHTLAKDLGLSENEEVLIRDLGVRLIYYVCEYVVDEEILQFYNTIIQWYIFTLSEVNLDRYKLSVIDLLDILCLNDSKDFCYIVLNKLR